MIDIVISPNKKSFSRHFLIKTFHENITPWLFSVYFLIVPGFAFIFALWHSETSSCAREVYARHTCKSQLLVGVPRRSPSLIYGQILSHLSRKMQCGQTWLSIMQKNGRDSSFMCKKKKDILKFLKWALCFRHINVWSSDVSVYRA